MAARLLQKYESEITKMKQEVEISVQEYQKSYMSCQNERKSLETRLKEVQANKKKNHKLFLCVAKDVVCLFFKRKKTKEQILQAISPINTYITCTEAEIKLKEQLQTAIENEECAANELEVAKSILRKISEL